MERIQITENDHTYHLFFDGKNLKLQVFDEEEIKNPFSFLKFFKPSPSTYLIGENTYYDPEYNLYHKYQNGEEEYTYFFEKNGSPLLFGNKQTSKSSERRVFRIKNLILCCSLAGLLLASSCQTAYCKEPKQYSSSDITVEYLKDAINSSTFLKEEEKQYLFNEDFLRDILPYINQSNYLVWKNKRCFDNISIVSYSDGENADVLGFYQTNTPSTLYIKNYVGLTDENKDHISHEYIHLCQDTRGYNLIIEACAEIISNEYFDSTQMKEYKEPVKLVKILMEIIGTKVIWEYNFNNNFKPIENRIKPYLTGEEYQEFLRDLSFDTRNPENNKEKYKSLYSLLEKLYKAMYQSDMKDNEVISLIRHNNPNLVRHYFNQRLIDKEPSYYTIPNEGSYEKISYEEAIKKKYLTITAVDKRPVSYEEAIKLSEAGEAIEREVDTSDNFVTVLRRTDSKDKTIISCIVNHQRYDNVDLDELAQEGIVSVTYYHIYSTKECTYEDYEKNSFNETTRIYISCPENTVFQKDGIICFVPTKIELPPVNQLDQSIQYIKK